MSGAGHFGSLLRKQKKKARTGRFYIYIYRVGKIVKILHQAEKEYDQEEHDRF